MEGDIHGTGASGLWSEEGGPTTKPPTCASPITGERDIQTDEFQASARVWFLDKKIWEELCGSISLEKSFEVQEEQMEGIHGGGHVSGEEGSH